MCCYDSVLSMFEACLICLLAAQPNDFWDVLLSSSKTLVLPLFQPLLPQKPLIGPTINIRKVVASFVG